MADELDRVIEKLKDVSEETKKMSDSFSGLTDMTDVSSDSLNSMKVMLKEFKDSISTNSTAMGISTAQTKLFNQQSTNAASLLNALSGEIKANGTTTTSLMNQFQTAMDSVQSSASGLMSNAAGGERAEVLKKLYEDQSTKGGLMVQGLSSMTSAVNNIVPELGQGWDMIKNSFLITWAKSATLPIARQWWMHRKERKLLKKRERALAAGMNLEDVTWDTTDWLFKKMSGVLGKDSWLGKEVSMLQEFRKKGMGIDGFEKLGAREVDTQLQKQISQLIDDQNTSKDALIATNEEAREKLASEIEELQGELSVEVDPEEAAALQEKITAKQTQEQWRISNIAKQESQKLQQNQEGLTKAVEELNSLTRGQEGHVEKTLEDVLEVNKEAFFGSPPYLQTIAETIQGHTQLLEQTAEAGAGDGGPIPEGATKDPPMPNFLGFLSGLGPAIKAIPGAIVKVLKGIGQGIAGMFKALGSIDPASLAMGLAAITGIALSMMMLAKALQIAGPVIVKIMGAIGKILTSVFEGYAKVIEAAGKVIVPILRAMANVIKAVGGVVMKFFKGFATVINAIGSVIGGVFKGIIGIFKAIGTVIETIGRVIVTIGRVIIDFIKTLVSSLIQLSEIPFWNYIKLAAAFVILGAALGIFGILAGVAVVPLIALGIASIGLAALMATIGDPERLSLLAMGFNTLALAVTKFAISSLALIPALGIFTALSAIPFINKLIGTQEGIAKKQEVGTFTAETLVVEGMGGGIAQAMLQQQMTAEGLTQEQGDIMPPGGQIITSNQTNITNRGTEVHVNKTAVDTNYLETMKGLNQVYA